MKNILFISLMIIGVLVGCAEQPQEEDKQISFDHADIIQQADAFLGQEPITVTTAVAERSAGGIHDFYSEGDYWWPNPDDPDGPYIRRDGESNPDNFTEHREAMRDLGRWVAALVAAYKVTGEKKYANHAQKHLRAWLVDTATMMNPNLLYAQAISGRVTGRGIGIIDAIHLIEVSKSIQQLHALNALSKEEYEQMRSWFDQFATWLTTHPYGIDERDHGNNHSTWWAAQVAVFAQLTERPELISVAQQQFKKLLSAQMEEDGSFPEELSRTKPYNYTLFNLEGYAILAEAASTDTLDLWTYETDKGSLEKAFAFMFPYIKDKSNWIKAPDVQHFDELPIQSTGLLFAVLAYNNKDWLQTWETLDPKPKSNEIDRTYPVRQPILWVE